MSDIKRFISKLLKTGSLIILTKIFGLASQIFLAAKLGISAISDSYFLVLILPTFVCNVMGSALGLSTIGLIKDKFIGIQILIKAFIAISTPLIFLTFFSTEIAKYIFSIPVATPKYEVFNILAVFFWPLTSLMCLSQIMSVWLNSRGHSLIPSATPLINSLTIIFFLYSFESSSVVKILIYSQIFSVITEFLVLFLSLRTNKIVSIRINKISNARKITIITKSVILTSIGWSLLSLSAPIEQFFASGLDSGTNAIVGLTNRLVIPICAALSSLITAILLQKLATLSESKDDRDYWEYYIKACFFLLLTSISISLIGFINSHKIIELAYGSNNFSELDKKNIENLFNISIFLIPAQIIISLSFRVYAIIEKSNLQTIFIFTSILIQIFFSFINKDYKIGVGIVSSTLLSNYVLALTYVTFGVFYANHKKNY